MSDSYDERGFKAYHEAVESFAREVFDRVKDDGADENDTIAETADDADWVIYTAHAIRVLEHSRNDDAGFEDMGKAFLEGCESMADAYTRAAYWAMRQDIAECLESNREEWEAEAGDKEEGAE